MKSASDDDGDDDQDAPDGADLIMTTIIGAVWARHGAQRFLSLRFKPPHNLRACRVLTSPFDR